MSWILIAVLLLLAGIVLIKLKEQKHKYFYTILFVIGLFLIISLIYVYYVSDISLKTYDGFVNLGKSYMSWLGAAFKNIGSISGYAVKQEWGINASGG
jgi:uncharacterized membrane protein YozB (DUF420 family)